jgi:hypothetical protein
MRKASKLLWKNELPTFSYKSEENKKNVVNYVSFCLSIGLFPTDLLTTAEAVLKVMILKQAVSTVEVT